VEVSFHWFLISTIKLSNKNLHRLNPSLHIQAVHHFRLYLTPRQARIIDNRTIRCIVISEKSDPNIRFEVFERLNTGGVPLNDQELRNCVFRGTFNELLDELSRDKTWLRLVGKTKPDERLRHHELILRFFAVQQGLNDYKPPLKKFLNDFMRANRDADKAKLADLKLAFQTAITSVDAAFGERAFRKVKISKDGSGQWDSAVNRAVFDIQMNGWAGTTSSCRTKETFGPTCG